MRTTDSQIRDHIVVSAIFTKILVSSCVFGFLYWPKSTADEKEDRVSHASLDRASESESVEVTLKKPPLKKTASPANTPQANQDDSFKKEVQEYVNQEPKKDRSESFAAQPVNDDSKESRATENRENLQTSFAPPKSKTDQVGQISTSIVAGENAPHFGCDVRECQKVARELDGFFVLLDGKKLYGIGRELRTPNTFSRKDTTWFYTFASRMAQVEETPQVKDILRSFASRTGGRQGKVLLSIPINLDRKILDAQTKWFQDRNMEIDVTLVSIGEFYTSLHGETEFRIMRMQPVQ